MRKVLVLILFSMCVSLNAQVSNLDSALNIQDTLTYQDSVPSIVFDSSYNYDYSNEEETPSINPEALKSTKAYQKEQLELKKFDKEKWEEIVGKTDYIEEPEEKKETKKTDFSAVGPWASAIIKILGYALIFALVAFVIYYVVKNSGVGNQSVKVRPKVQNLSAPVDDIEGLDFTAMLEDAMRDGNMRLVIRIHYLRLLHVLHVQGKIKWKKHKTNSDYLVELLNDNSLFTEVRKLTLAYEAVWYGELTLSGDVYSSLVNGFEQTTNQFQSVTA